MGGVIYRLGYNAECTSYGGLMASFFSGLIDYGIFMFWMLFCLGGFLLGITAVQKLLSFIPRKQEGTKTRWVDVVSAAEYWFAVTIGLVVSNGILYFIKEAKDIFVLVLFLSKLLSIFFFFAIIYYLFRWFDEKTGRVNKIGFEPLFFVLVFISIIFLYLNQGEQNKQLETRLNLRDKIGEHLLGKQHEPKEVHKKIALLWEPERMFVTNCLTNLIVDNVPQDIPNYLRILHPSPAFKLPEDKENLSVFNDMAKSCTETREGLKPEFNQLINSKLFNDLRPDLAEYARRSFFVNAFVEGPTTIKQYIFLINQSEGIISRDSMQSGEKQRTLLSILGFYDKKHEPFRFWKDVNQQYKVANCEHIVKLGPEGGFGSPVRPDEKTLADRKKCREEKNLPVE
jgi:hypothetical protein